MKRIIIVVAILFSVSYSCQQEGQIENNQVVEQLVVYNDQDDVKVIEEEEIGVTLRDSEGFDGYFKEELPMCDLAAGITKRCWMPLEEINTETR